MNTTSTQVRQKNNVCLRKFPIEVYTVLNDILVSLDDNVYVDLSHINSTRIGREGVMHHISGGIVQIEEIFINPPKSKRSTKYVLMYALDTKNPKRTEGIVHR